MNITAYDLAKRYIGVRELDRGDHPLIQWWLSLCGFGFDAADEIPWCAAFVNGIAWELGLPRSKSAAARSWLTVGEPVPVAEASSGFDVVVLQRGAGNQPGPEVTSGAPGHVGFFAGWSFVGPTKQVMVLGGNQANAVTISAFMPGRVLGVRRLA